MYSFEDYTLCQVTGCYWIQAITKTPPSALIDFIFYRWEVIIITSLKLKLKLSANWILLLHYRISVIKKNILFSTNNMIYHFYYKYIT